ncbi:cytochrome P450 [Clavulina sp. PMI_390]|nr:cytochrome P450 [Clavulina sp. PMI_390]
MQHALVAADDNTFWVRVEWTFCAMLVAFSFGQLVALYDGMIRPRWMLRNLPRPSGGHLPEGHLTEIRAAESGQALKLWHSLYGRVFFFNSIFGVSRISIADSRALRHILVEEAYNFPKSPLDRSFLGAFLGQGLLVAEGDTHLRQRRVVNPAFGTNQMKEFYPTMLERALKFCDDIVALLNCSPVLPMTIDLVQHTNAASLDILMAAGFGNDLGGKASDDQQQLIEVFKNYLEQNRGLGLTAGLRLMVPVLRYVPDPSKRSKVTRTAKETMKCISLRMIAQRRADMEALEAIGVVDTAYGKDILTLLIKANMAQGVKQRLSDEELIAQMSTFLFAGHETTATAINWATFQMVKYPPSQEALQKEVLNVSTDTPTYDELSSLPYLDAVVRETLRMSPPVVGTVRMAAKDTIIPLGEEIIDVNGRKMKELLIPRKCRIDVPNLTINTDPAIWGADAAEFRPERWLEVEKLPEGVMEVPSLAFPTFLAGPRACIGFRFAMLEMKVILFAIMRSVKFAAAVPVDDIESKTFMVSYPRVKSKPEAGAQLPVLASLA